MTLSALCRTASTGRPEEENPALFSMRLKVLRCQSNTTTSVIKCFINHPTFFPARRSVHPEADASARSPVLPGLCPSLLHLYHWSRAAEGWPRTQVLSVSVRLSAKVNTLHVSITASDRTGKDPWRLQDRIQELTEQHGKETGPSCHGESLLRTQDGSGLTRNQKYLNGPLF